MRCDFCRADCAAHYYDAATKHGPWATMCPTCWPKQRRHARLGTGSGQEYRLAEDGKRRKVAG